MCCFSKSLFLLKRRPSSLSKTPSRWSNRSLLCYLKSVVGSGSRQSSLEERKVGQSNAPAWPRIHVPGLWQDRLMILAVDRLRCVFPPLSSNDDILGSGSKDQLNDGFSLRYTQLFIQTTTQWKQITRLEFKFYLHARSVTSWQVSVQLPRSHWGSLHPCILFIIEKKSYIETGSKVWRLCVGWVHVPLEYNRLFTPQYLISWTHFSAKQRQELTT